MCWLLIFTLVYIDISEQIAVLFILLKTEQNSQHRRPWIHEILQRRNKYGHHHLLQELRLNKCCLQWYFCLSMTHFGALLSHSGGRITWTTEGKVTWHSGAQKEAARNHKYTSGEKNRTGTRLLAVSPSGTIEAQQEIGGFPQGISTIER